MVLYNFFINFNATVESIWNGYWTDINNFFNYFVEKGPVFSAVTIGLMYMVVAFLISAHSFFFTVILVGLAWAEDEGEHVSNTFGFIWEVILLVFESIYEMITNFDYWWNVSLPRDLREI